MIISFHCNFLETRSLILLLILWKSPSKSELTPYLILSGLTHLGSEASLYLYHKEDKIGTNKCRKKYFVIHNYIFCSSSNFIDISFQNKLHIDKIYIPLNNLFKIFIHTIGRLQVKVV